LLAGHTGPNAPRGACRDVTVSAEARWSD
jgi:hypothetical protein